MNVTYINPSEVRRALEILHPDGEVFEIRIVLEQNRGALSGYFKSIDKAIEVLARVSQHDLRGSNVYTLLNPLLGACYSRAQSDRIIRVKEATKDSEVTRLKWLFIDLDPVRISGISSSDEELAKARERAVNVYQYLKKEGFPEPLIGMSGNGYHLLYRIDMPIEKASLNDAFLETMSMLFSDKVIKIDTINFNPGRPCKLYGTLAQKGAGTEERPHRLAHIIKAPEQFEVVPLECIEKIAAMLPKEEEKKTVRKSYSSYSNKEEFDLDKFITEHSDRIKVKSKIVDSRWTKYILEECIFNSDHRGTSAAIIKVNGGPICYCCQHDSCKDKMWQDARLAVEPDAYDHKDDYDDDGRIDAGWAEHKKMMARTRAQNIDKEENTKEEQTQTQTQIEEDIPLTAPTAPQRTFRKLKSAADLLKKELPKTRTFWGIGDRAPLLREGTCILSAKPKLGKSWLAMCLCLAAANGADFLGRKMEQCSALYLDLESSEELQQERLMDVLAANPDLDLSHFYLETVTDKLDMGFVEQIENYMEQDSDIGIVVIDVFQKIKTAARSYKELEYDHAYRDFEPLNNLANKYHLSIILVFHNRKAVDDEDPFSDVMGSNGNLGAATQLMVMYQKKNGPIHIAINGRTIKGRQDLDVTFKDGAWSLVDAGSSMDREKEQLLKDYTDSPIRTAVLKISDEYVSWKGKCSSIINEAAQLGVGITDTPKALGGFLHKHQGRFLEQDGIRLQFISNGTGSKFYKIEKYNPGLEKELGALEEEGFFEV